MRIKNILCNKATLERQQEDKMGTKSAKPLLAQFQPQFTMGCIQENRDLCKRFRFFLFIFNYYVKFGHIPVIAQLHMIHCLFMLVMMMQASTM